MKQPTLYTSYLNNLGYHVLQFEWHHQLWHYTVDLQLVSDHTQCHMYYFLMMSIKKFHMNT